MQFETNEKKAGKIMSRPPGVRAGVRLSEYLKIMPDA
jgi:hypothetical protein